MGLGAFLPKIANQEKKHLMNFAYKLKQLI